MNRVFQHTIWKSKQTSTKATNLLPSQLSAKLYSIDRMQSRRSLSAMIKQKFEDFSFKYPVVFFSQALNQIWTALRQIQTGIVLGNVRSH